MQPFFTGYNHISNTSHTERSEYMEPDKDYNLMIGLRIREIREARDLSREKFSEKCDISASFLADVERGKKSITSKTLYKICTSMHISADYLLFGNGNGFEIDTITELLRPLDEQQLKYAVSIISAYTAALKTSSDKNKESVKSIHIE